MNKGFLKSTWTDEKLIEELRSSKRDAFEYFYKTYFPMIKNFISTNSGNADDAKDIFQECLIDFYEKLKMKNLNLNCSVKTYFYSICRNQWLTQLKRNSRNTSLTETHDEKIEIKNTYEQRESLNERQKILKSLIQKLGSKCQQILILFYYEKLSMTVIAKNLGYTNAENVKNQKYKCFKQLKVYANNNSMIKDIL